MSTSPFAAFLSLLGAAYIAGSVNFSILAFRFTGRDDPRHGGSGNPGATNVYRQAGMGWAIAVLILDVGRAASVAMAACAVLPFWQIPWAGFALILGNRFPCFHGFRGGKGVANFLGFTLPLAPVWAGFSLLAWGAAHLIWRTPFIASFAMLIFLATGASLAAKENAWGIVGVLLTAVFIVICHHRNIRTHWRRRKQTVQDGSS
jgi:glycerol-3-phosphate acyltransferase PlsY